MEALLPALLQAVQSGTHSAIPCRHVNLYTWVLKERSILDAKSITEQGDFPSSCRFALKTALILFATVKELHKASAWDVV